jgi:hypothetical protein
MIAWKYIDKISATIGAIRDYQSMRSVINITPQDIKELYDRMVSTRSPQLSGMPHARNPHAKEDELVKSLDKLDIMQERYRQAIEYMAWFEPSWGSLTDNEQLIIQEFYMNGSLKSGANARLQQKLDYSESQIDKLRSKALIRLSFLLFGK